VRNLVRMNPVRQQVADRIHAAMEVADETTYGLAQKTLIPKSTLLRKLGGGASFTVDELDAIATALKVDVAELVRGVAA